MTSRSTHDNPIRIRDPITGESARVRVYILDADGDNPMQSEMSGHIGGNGNYDCRRCKRGGTEAWKITDEGYASLYEVCRLLFAISAFIETFHRHRTLEQLLRRMQNSSPRLHKLVEVSSLMSKPHRLGRASKTRILSIGSIS